MIRVLAILAGIALATAFLATPAVTGGQKAAPVPPEAQADPCGLWRLYAPQKGPLIQDGDIWSIRRELIRRRTEI